MVDRGTAFLISLVTSLFVAILVNFAFYYWVEPALQRSKRTTETVEKQIKNVEVPDLRGSLPSQAKLVLSQLGLSLVVEGEMESAEYPEGTIGEQRPLPGSVLQTGSSIYVKIVKTKEAQSVKVPPVMGLDLASAQRLIIEKGFLIGEIKKEANEEIPEGHVIKTYPPAGMELPKGSKVTIYVSAGAELVTVPRLIGKYLYQARGILEKAGLTLGNVYKQVSAEYPENKIIGQNPRPGAKVKKGTKVDITIATVREELY